MYAVYKYLNGATAANVLADVVAILTGTTDVNTLSASCDKVNSSIFSTNAAGWEMHDASAGTNSVVLKAAVHDNASQYKYMWLTTNTAGYFGCALYETWNATSHTGTNVCNNDTSSTGWQRVNYAFATGGFLYISATARHALFHSLSSGSTLGQTGTATQVSTSWAPHYNAGATMSTGSGGGVSGCVEYARWSPWDTSTSGYLCAASINNSGGASAGYLGNNMRPFVCPPRIRGFNGVDWTGNASMGVLGTPIPTGYDNYNGWHLFTQFAPPNNKITNGAGSYITPMLPMTCGNINNGWFGGNISEKCNAWFLPYSLGYMGDEITVSGQQYVVWAIPGQLTQRMAVFKG